jgi:hypothetical protein
MAVENLTVSLGTTSPYDTVSATIRGKTEPQIEQSFSLDMDGISVFFEVETVSEMVRGAAESVYAITGIDGRSEYLYRPVDFIVGMIRNGADWLMPDASTLLAMAGTPCVYQATYFRPTAGGMGWTVTEQKSNGVVVGKTVRVRETNRQALLNKLFSWTNDYGPYKICWHMRGGVIYVWDQATASGQSITLTDDMCSSIKIDSRKIRTYTEATDTTGDPITTPVETRSFAWNYEDVSYSGGHSENGALLSYSDGVLVSSIKIAGNNTTTEEYTYQTWLGAPCLSRKTTTVVTTDTTSNDSTTKKAETTYLYGLQREGSTTGTGRQVPVLTQESTQSWTDGTPDAETITIDYHSSGNGFYSMTAAKYDSGNIVEVQNSVSRGSPGGAASQATEKRCTGFSITVTPPATTPPGYSTVSTRLPIQYGDALLYLARIEALNGSIEKKLTAEVVGQPALNPVLGFIVYRGVTYYATEATVTQSSSGKRMTLKGIRWN